MSRKASLRHCARPSNAGGRGVGAVRATVVKRTPWIRSAESYARARGATMRGDCARMSVHDRPRDLSSRRDVEPSPARGAFHRPHERSRGGGCSGVSAAGRPRAGGAWPSTSRGREAACSGRGCARRDLAPRQLLLPLLRGPYRPRVRAADCSALCSRSSSRGTSTGAVMRPTWRSRCCPPKWTTSGLVVEAASGWRSTTSWSPARAATAPSWTTRWTISAGGCWRSRIPAGMA
jgi:hypothetical protein